MPPNFFSHTIQDVEHNFSTRLKQKRETLFISRKTAAQDLKVLEKYIAAAEEDNTVLLSPTIYTINFLKRYASYLKEDPEAIVQLFKKSRPHLFKEEKINQKPARSFMPMRSRFVQYAITTLAVVGVLGYLLVKAIVITSPPDIIVYEPADNNIVSTSVIVVRGKSDTSATVKINGQSVSLDTDGRFSQELVLGTGVNVIKISGAKRYSRERVIVRQITVSGGKNVSLNIQ